MFVEKKIHVFVNILIIFQENLLIFIKIIFFYLSRKFVNITM